MRINSAKKIVVEDFPQAERSLVQRLALIMNNFLEQIAQALTNNLTISENLKAKVYKQQMASGVSTLRVTWDLNEKPNAVFVGSLTRTDGVVPPVFCLHWTYSDKIITCTFTGLGTAIHNVTLIGMV